MPENAMPEARVDSHDQAERNFASNIFRYGLATIGPVGGAASQFILSVQLLHALQPSSFGSFSFLLVASQFGGGLWSALFCAPLPILLTQGNEAERRAMLRCLFVTNLALAGLAFFVFWILGTWLGTPNVASILFAAYAAVALLRWFARAHAYAVGAPLRTITSDLLYSAVLLAGVGLIALSGSNTVELPYAALLVSAALGLLPFGWRYLDQQFIRISLRDLPRYADVWRRHSSWSLTEVVTTEATVNAHAYLVTFFFGPAAFAPVAASALIIRPIGVVMNAVTDFERPDLARQIDESRLGGVMRSIRAFRVVLIAAWVATAIAAAGLMTYAPGLIFPSRYDFSIFSHRRGPVDGSCGNSIAAHAGGHSAPGSRSIPVAGLRQHRLVRRIRRCRRRFSRRGRTNVVDRGNTFRRGRDRSLDLAGSAALAGSVFNDACSASPGGRRRNHSRKRQLK